MILSCSKISKEFVTGPVLTDVTFLVNEQDRTAIVGMNGAGKSTLLKIITGEMKPDNGEIFLAKDITVGYLAQHQDFDASSTIFDLMLETKKEVLELFEQIRTLEMQMKEADEENLSQIYEEYAKRTHAFEQKNGYAYKSEITGILKGLGFTEEEFNRLASSLSGGQKTRVHLAKILLSKPDLLLLDEPTNHLDISSVMWLESYLKSYPGAVIIVSHDRYFLDKIATKVVELEQTKATVFTGNYSDYAIKKKALRESQLRSYLNQQKVIAHQEAVIEKLRSFNREKSIKRAESREKLLNKIERAERPPSFDAEMHFTLHPYKKSGKDVAKAESLRKAFGDHLLFEDISFEIKRGERVALIGGNGTGKTTILKILNGLLDADQGDIRFGTNVEVGYYDQEHQILDPSHSVFEEILNAYPYLTNTEIRNVLAGFLFTDEDVFKKISTLSGGEKGRVSLAKLMLSEANFLILDEPTNHLDIVSKEILEEVLCSYTGTVLYVSHDRYFINKTATRILDLKEKKLLNYIGNYDYYLEKKEDVEKLHLSPSSSLENTSVDSLSESRIDWKKQKEEQAKIRKIQNKLAKIEEEIEKLEADNVSLDSRLSDPAIAAEVGKLMEIHKKKTANEERLEKLMERWEELSSNTP